MFDRAVFALAKEALRTHRLALPTELCRQCGMASSGTADADNNTNLCPTGQFSLQRKKPLEHTQLSMPAIRLLRVGGFYSSGDYFQPANDSVPASIPFSKVEAPFSAMAGFGAEFR